jgi:hypothetical protein
VALKIDIFKYPSPLLISIHKAMFSSHFSHFLRHVNKQEITISHQIVTFGGEKDPAIVKKYMTKHFLNINK